MDTLQIYSQLCKLRSQVAPDAAAALCEMPHTYEAGYAIGRYEALVDVMAIVRNADTPTPPKATGSAEWSAAARAWFEKVQKRDQKDVLVDWSDKWPTKPQ